MAFILSLCWQGAAQECPGGQTSARPCPHNRHSVESYPPDGSPMGSVGRPRHGPRPAHGPRQPMGNTTFSCGRHLVSIAALARGAWHFCRESGALARGPKCVRLPLPGRAVIGVRRLGGLRDSGSRRGIVGCAAVGRRGGARVQPQLPSRRHARRCWSVARHVADQGNARRNDATVARSTWCDGVALVGKSLVKLGNTQVLFNIVSIFGHQTGGSDKTWNMVFRCSVVVVFTCPAAHVM